MRLLRGEIPMSMKSEWAQQWRPLDQRWISGCFPRIREQTARSSLIPLGASHKLQILKHKTSNFKTHFGWAKGRDIFLISLTSCLFELLQHWQLMLRYVLGGRTQELKAMPLFLFRQTCLKLSFASNRDVVWGIFIYFPSYEFPYPSSVQLPSHVRLFATPWIAARQASLSITNSRSPPKPMSIE